MRGLTRRALAPVPRVRGVTDARERRAVVQAARHLERSGLTHGTSGNVSLRMPAGFLITPTGIAPDALTTADVVRCDDAGAPTERQRAPSSEWRIHRDVYAARPDAGAVVHTHSPYATAIACLRQPLPAVHYMIAAAGGDDVRCAEYATFGTPELSRNVLGALEGREGCLLANHGVVALGADLDRAMRVGLEIERVAQVYWLTLAAGTPCVLAHDEMVRVVERFRRYGQPATSAPRPAGRGTRRGSRP
jgi:L-fuculose-phosphate aldolase